MGGEGAVCVRTQQILSPAWIIRALPGDGHVMHMAFAQARRGDAYELRFLLQILDRLGADIAHGRAQAARQLVQDTADRATIGHLSLNTFRHQLQRVLDVLLEIAIR